MLLTKDKKFTGQLLNVKDQTYMCAYLGMYEQFDGSVIVKFLVNGVNKSVVLSIDDLLSLASDVNGYEPEDLDRAQDSVDQWISSDVAEFINDWGLYQKAC